MLKVMSNWNKNEEGATLVFVGVCLAVLLGLAALTFDLGRVAATQSDMQAYADNVALAAAGELDGQPDSITRALEAARKVIDDRQTFATGVQDLTFDADIGLPNIRFLSGLPNTDREYFDADDDLTGFVTTDPLDATLVEVRTVNRSVFLPFFRAFAVISDATPTDGLVRARAVAGFTQYACDIATLMFCLPDGFDINEEEGISLQLRTGGQNAAWGPGDFGFLDPSQNAVDPNGDCAGLTGVQQDACLIASSGNRTRCFAQRGVDLEPGQKVGIENAVFNTRFDMYNGTMSNNRNSDVFAPSIHSVTGLQSASGNGNGGGNVCLGNNVEPTVAPDPMAFPQDDCHGDGSCGRFGDGEWDVEQYMLRNHGYATLTDAQAGDFSGMTLSEASRFDVYNREIENALAPGGGGKILPSSNPNQTCTSATPDPNPNRRVFIAAGIDCDEQNIQGSATGVAVEEYYEVFLIRPVGDGSGSNGNTNTFDMWVEFLGSAGGDGSGNADDGGIFREVVELYR